MNKIKINDIELANQAPLVLIAGPCAIESSEHALRMAHLLKDISVENNFQLIFKCSFDKANRTSVKSERGVGLKESIPIFEKIKLETKLPILTDVHETYQCEEIKDCVDVIQIPAFLARQTDLLMAAAKTNKVINIKKSQFMSPWEAKYPIEKIESQSNKKIILTERGYTFGYNNLVVDYRSIEVMKKFAYPVVFDATHSVQLPGGGNNKSSGQKEFIDSLSTAAVSLGISGVFAEVHDNPNIAISDSENQLDLEAFDRLTKKLMKFDALAKNN